MLSEKGSDPRSTYCEIFHRVQNQTKVIYGARKKNSKHLCGVTTEKNESLLGADALFLDLGGG